MVRPPRSSVLLTALVAAALLIAACSDSDTDSAATTTSGATATSADVTPGGGDNTTSTVLPTTAPESTTTVATTAPPTTVPPTPTEPPEPRPDGLVLLGDGLGPLAFGATPESAIEFLSAALGSPMADSGWTDSFSVYGTCPGSQVRGVEWPGFLALFGDADDDYSNGARHFMSWTVGWFGPDPFGMRTPEGVGIGDSRDRVAGRYLAASFSAAEGPFPASVDIPTDRGDLYGFFEDEVTLSSLTAGTRCGE